MYKEIQTFPIIDKLPKRLRKPAYGLAGAISLSTAAAFGAVCGAGSEKDWFYTQGPHADGLSAGQLYAVDIAPEAVEACPGGLPVTSQMMEAPIDGVISAVGNEKDPGDKNHSIVLEKLSDGSYLGFMHLDKIKMGAGQNVKAGDVLGAPSCEFPPGGRTTGVHVHVFRLDSARKPLSVVGMNINGWLVNADGTLTKAGEQARTADVRRCGPGASSIAACGGIRNDIPKADSLVVNGQIVAGPTNPSPPNIQQFPSPEVSHTSTRAEDIENKKREAVGLADKFTSLMMSGEDADIEKANLMEIPLDKKNPQYERADLYDKGEYGGPFGGFRDLQICSYQMRAGQTQNWQLTIIGWPPVDLSSTEILNRQNGLGLPDRYTVSVDFTYRDFNRDFPGHRGPFRDYKANAFLTNITFEDVGGRLYIAQDTFCFGAGSPLEIVVGQLPLAD